MWWAPIVISFIVKTIVQFIKIAFLALIKLDVTHNNLKYLPKLGELRKIQFLYAQHNDIEELPDFEGCENIQQLFFGNNFIKVTFISAK